MQHNADRRSRRSPIKEVALTYQLEASAARAQVDSMVLADQSGLLVAHSNEPDAAWVAAVSATRSFGRFWVGPVYTARGVRQVAVTPIQVTGGKTLLCAVGDVPHNLGAELVRAAAGIRRIMAG